MKYDFYTIIDRSDTSSSKWDRRKKAVGVPDVLPMWVADMDFEVPDFIREAVKERAEHEIYGYTFRSEKYNESIAGWMKKRDCT